MTAALPRISRPIIALILALLIPATAGAAAALSPLALSCQGCHRPGRDSPPFVALERLSAASIEASLKHSRDQPDAAAIMPRFTRNMSDEQMRSLAAELSPTAAAP